MIPTNTGPLKPITSHSSIERIHPIISFTSTLYAIYAPNQAMCCIRYESTAILQPAPVSLIRAFIFGRFAISVQVNSYVPTALSYGDSRGQMENKHQRWDRF